MYNGGLRVRSGEKFIVFGKQAKALKPAGVLPTVDLAAFGLPSLSALQGNARSKAIGSPPKKTAGRVLGNQIPCFATLERAVPMA